MMDDVERMMILVGGAVFALLAMTSAILVDSVVKTLARQPVPEATPVQEFYFMPPPRDDQSPLPNNDFILPDEL